MIEQSKNDILLIQPAIGNPNHFNKPEKELDKESYAWKTRETRVPQSLLSLGTILDSKGYKVGILDCRLHYSRGYENYIKKLKGEIKNTTLLIGISVMTPYIKETLEIIKAIKKVNDKIPIVLGGIHPTLLPKQTCEDKDVDFVIVGDGEYPLLELVKALDKKKSYKNVQGLVYKERGKVIVNPLGKPFDIQNSPFPAYHLLEMNKYLPWVPFYSDKKTLGLDYLMTRGCPFQCAFCVNKILPQSRVWRTKTPKKIIEELKVLKKRYNFDYVYFEDDNAMLNIKNFREIAEGIRDENVKYLATIRVDTLVNTQKDILQQIQKSGWRETIIGAESGSDNILERLKKGITVDQTLKAAKILNELDIWTAYNLITCIPSETHKERKLTYNFMKILKKIHPNSLLVGPHLFRPFPGSELYEDCLKKGFKEPKTFRAWINSPMFNTTNPSNLPWVKDYSFFEDFEKYIKIYGGKELFKKGIKKISRIILKPKNFNKNQW